MAKVNSANATAPFSMMNEKLNRTTNSYDQLTNLYSRLNIKDKKPSAKMFNGS